MNKKPITFQGYQFFFSEENDILVAQTRGDNVDNMDQAEEDFVRELLKPKLNYQFLSRHYDKTFNHACGFAQVNSKSHYIVQGFLLTLTGVGNKKLYWDKNVPNWFENYKKELSKTDSGLFTIKFTGIPEGYERLEGILKSKNI